MNTITLNPQEIINVTDDELKTTSLQVADTFKKKHKDILRKLDDLISQMPSEWYKRNFTPIQIDIDLGENRTRKSRAFEMTKDGFVFLVMSFTGKLANQIKIAYIEAFNFMAEQLHNSQPKLESPYINDEQLRHIKTGVGKIVKETGKSFPTVYNTLFDFVKAPRLREIKKERYELACSFLGINPDFEVKADKVQRLTDKSYQSTIHGLAFMEYALHVKREQDKRIRKLQDALGEVYDLFEQVVRCNGAVFDGLYEPSNYLSTEKDQREQTKILGEKMFNSWKQQEKKFS